MNDQMLTTNMEHEGHDYDYDGDDPTVARARRLLGAIRDKREILSDKVQFSRTSYSEQGTTGDNAASNSRLSTDYNDQITQKLLQSLNERRSRVQRMVEEKKEDCGTIPDDSIEVEEDCESACESLYFDESVSIGTNARISSSLDPLIIRADAKSKLPPRSCFISNNAHYSSMAEMKQSYKKDNLSFGTEFTGTTTQLTSDSTRCSYFDVRCETKVCQDESASPQAQEIYAHEGDDSNADGDDFSIDDYPATFAVDSSSNDSKSMASAHYSRGDDIPQRKDSKTSLDKPHVSDLHIRLNGSSVDKAIAESLGLDSTVWPKDRHDRSCNATNARSGAQARNEAALSLTDELNNQTHPGEGTDESNAMTSIGLTEQVAGASARHCGLHIAENPLFNNRQETSKCDRETNTSICNHPLANKSAQLFDHLEDVADYLHSNCNQALSFDASTLTSSRAEDQCQQHPGDRRARSFDYSSLTGPCALPKKAERGSHAEHCQAFIANAKRLDVESVRYSMDDDDAGIFVSYASRQGGCIRSHSYDGVLDVPVAAGGSQACQRQTLSFDAWISSKHTGFASSKIDGNKAELGRKRSSNSFLLKANVKSIHRDATLEARRVVNSSRLSAPKKDLLQIDAVNRGYGDNMSSSLSDDSATYGFASIGGLHLDVHATLPDKKEAQKLSGDSLSSEAQLVMCRKAKVIIRDSDGEDLSLSLIESDDSSSDFTTDSNTSGWMSESYLDCSLLLFPKEVQKPENDGDISEFSGEVGDSLLGDLDALVDEPSLLGSCYSFEANEKSKARDRSESSLNDDRKQNNSIEIARTEKQYASFETRWILVDKFKQAKTSTHHVTWNLPTLPKETAAKHYRVILDEEEADKQCRVNRGLYAIALGSGLQIAQPTDVQAMPLYPKLPEELPLSADLRCGAQGSMYDLAIKSGFDLSQPWIWKKHKKFIPARGGLWYLSGLNKKMLRSRKPFTVKTKPVSLEQNDDVTILPEDITDYECGANGSLFLAFETAGGDYIATGSLYFLATQTPGWLAIKK